MAEYKDIIGTAVQTVAGDPDNPVKGQLWYNSTTAEFMYQELAYGTYIRWAIGGTSSSTTAKYYTNDEWEIEFDGQPIESGSGIGALQVIRSDY